MYNFFIIIFFMLSILNMQAQNLESLKTKIDSIFKSLDGDFAITFKVVDDGKGSILINEKMIFHAASTMKTPVMIEVFKQAAEDKFNLDDPVEINNEFKSIADGSPYYLDITDD